MPGRHRGGQRHRKAVQEAERAERTCVFGKTKLCKFHILGTCTKGSDCHFAHHPDEMRELPDLSFSKLCRTLINVGRCEDPACKYAHGREELRASPLEALRAGAQAPQATAAEAEERSGDRSWGDQSAALSAGARQTSGADAQETLGVDVAPATSGMQRASRSFGSSLALIEEEHRSDEDSTTGSDDARVASPAEKFRNLSPWPLDVSGGMGVTVKNTFIDVEFAQPCKLGFRAIKTAGGRLDLLCQEGADDRTECF